MFSQLESVQIQHLHLGQWVSSKPTQLLFSTDITQCLPVQPQCIYVRMELTFNAIYVWSLVMSRWPPCKLMCLSSMQEARGDSVHRNRIIVHLEILPNVICQVQSYVSQCGGSRVSRIFRYYVSANLAQSYSCDLYCIAIFVKAHRVTENKGGY